MEANHQQRRAIPHPHLGIIAGVALNFVFAKPIVDARVEQHAATVGVDVDAIVVRSGLAPGRNWVLGSWAAHRQPVERKTERMRDNLISCSSIRASIKTRLPPEIKKPKNS